MKYLVNDLYPCLQGEGVQTGVPMYLLRLHGCPVGCPWCDTKETWHTEERNQVATLAEALGANPKFAVVEAEEVVAAIQALPAGPEWVLLTGGEPADQQLGPLIEALHDAGCKVALETSGTALGHCGAGCDWVCVSPKIGMPGGRKVRGDALVPAHEIKHVVGRAEDIQQLDKLLKEHALFLREDVVICLQPVSQSEKATELCVQTAMARGWRVSLQAHKYIGQR
jgi:7-carboxy-7-deazaguanine synthase